MCRSEFSLRGGKSIFSALLLAVLGFLASCNASDHISHRASNDVATNGGDVNAKLSIAVEVTSFKPQAIHDDFADGVSKSYDLTLLTIVEPGAHRGATLQVMHSGDSALEPMWTSIGERCVVVIEAWLLSDAEMLIPRQNVEMTCAK